RAVHPHRAQRRRQQGGPARPPRHPRLSALTMGAPPKPATKKAAAKAPRKPKATASPAAEAPVRRVPPLSRDRGLVPVAEVARPHGIQGELRLKVYTPDSDLLPRRPTVLLRLPDGSEREARITACREADKALLVRLDGVSDRDQAEALRGAEL